MEFLRSLFGRSTNKDSGNSTPTDITPQLLWESAERMKERGLTRMESGMVGHVVGIARRSAGLTLEELAQQSGNSLEDIVDLNLGTLPLSHAVTMIEELKHLLPIDEKLYRSAIFEDSKKEEPF